MIKLLTYRYREISYLEISPYRGFIVRNRRKFSCGLIVTTLPLLSMPRSPILRTPFGSNNPLSLSNTAGLHRLT